MAAGRDRSADLRDNRELDFYAAAVRQGIQPETTRTPDIQRAVEASESMGRPFDAQHDHVISNNQADRLMKAVDKNGR